jgi:uncharacterized membrane-anchored protein YhcB (DUF1043 family)
MMKKLPTTAVVVGLVVIGVIIASIFASSAAKKSQYQTQLNHLKSLENQYQSISQQYYGLPSTTTKVKADWDTYYDGLNSQLSGITSSISNASYSNELLTAFSQDIQKSTSDLSGSITLSKSLSDMQFQIQNDNSTISLDQGNVQLDTAQDNTSCNLSVDNPYITCDRSLENQAKTQLSTAQTQLSTDKAAVQSQTTQQDSLGKRIASDTSSMFRDEATATAHKP